MGDNNIATHIVKVVGKISKNCLNHHQLKSRVRPPRCRVVEERRNQLEVENGSVGAVHLKMILLQVVVRWNVVQLKRWLHNDLFTRPQAHPHQ